MTGAVVTGTTGPRTARPTASFRGRWLIDETRSSARVAVRFGFFGTIHGCFAGVSGLVTMNEDPSRSQIAVSVPTAGLTCGRGAIDAMLTSAGVVDSRANPVLLFTSGNVGPCGTGSWTLAGVLASARSSVDITLEMSAPEPLADGSLLCRARGSIPSAEAVRLLSHPGLERVLGRSMGLDLLVVANRG